MIAAARRYRRHLLPAVAFSAVAIGVLTVAAATPASAIVQDAISVDVASSVKSAVPLGDGNCEWTVSSEITVYNVTNPAVTITYAQVWPTVAWTDSSANTSGVVSAPAITTVNDGGLHAGDTLAGPQFTFASYSPYTVQFEIPCDADFADLQVHIKTAGGANTSGDAPFLDSGSSVPAVPVAAAFGATTLAGTFLITRRRRRRQKSALATP
jgi:hypothetical protein